MTQTTGSRRFRGEMGRFVTFLLYFRRAQARR